MLLRPIIGWMAGEGLSRFAEIDPAAVERFCTWLRRRPSRPGHALDQTGHRHQLSARNQGSLPAAFKAGRCTAGRSRCRWKRPMRLPATPVPTKGAIPFIPEPQAIAILSRGPTVDRGSWRYDRDGRNDPPRSARSQGLLTRKTSSGKPRITCRAALRVRFAESARRANALGGAYAVRGTPPPTSSKPATS
jgi:hypothetical protein